MTAPHADPFLLTVLGKPGSSKTKLAAWLARRLGAGVIDCGELVRASLPTAAENIRQAVARGELVPDAFVAEAIFSRVRTTASNIVLVGFPRTIAQLSLLLEAPVARRLLFLCLEISDDLARCRVAERSAAEIRKKGASRSDAAAFERRLAEYYHHTQPVIDLLRESRAASCFSLDTSRLKKRPALEALCQAFSLAEVSPEESPAKEVPPPDPVPPDKSPHRRPFRLR